MGNGFAALDRVARILLETVGHAGEVVEDAPALGDVAGVKLSDRKCSPSEEFETIRLDGLS